MMQNELKQDEVDIWIKPQFSWLNDYPEDIEIEYEKTYLYEDICDYMDFGGSIINEIVLDYNDEKSFLFSRKMALVQLASVNGGHKVLEALDKTFGGIDLSITTPVGRTLLMQAIYCEQKETVEFLIQKGVDVNARNKFKENLATFAIFSHNAKMVEWCYNKFPQCFDLKDYSLNLMGIACAENQLDMVKFFLSKGGDINYNSPKDGSLLDQSLIFGEYETAVFLIEEGATLIDFNTTAFVPQDLFAPLVKRLKELNDELASAGTLVDFTVFAKIKRIRAFLNKI